MVRAQDHLFGLDLLRFLAAVLVCLNHFATYSRHGAEVTSETGARAFLMLWFFEDLGAVGVQIFFVISGLVIARSAANRLGRAGGTAFAKARIWRIVPALWLSTFVGFVALWVNDGASLDLVIRLLKSLLLVPIAPHIDGVIWTLMVEVIFYLVVGLSIVVFGRAPLVPIGMTLGVVSGTYLTLLLFSDLMGWSALYSVLLGFPLTFFLCRHGVYFALGILIWAAVSGCQKIRSGWVCVLICCAIIEIWFAMQQDLATTLASVLIFLLAIWFMIWVSSRKGSWRYDRLCRWLGALSYPLYLNHYTIGMCVTYWTAWEMPELVHLLVSVSAILAISAAVLYLEQAIRRRSHPRGIFRTMVRPPLT